MGKLLVERVNALPAQPAPSALYIVKSSEAGLADVYFTNSDGTELRHIITKADVVQLIAAAGGSGPTAPEIQVVADIPTRNMLNLQRTTLLLVLDATGDPTVHSGSAMYVWDMATLTFYKVSEFESMDITLDWNSIQNKPTSSPAQIDSAVDNSHSHGNKTLLDNLGEDGNELLTYRNKLVSNVVALSEW